MGVVLDEHDVAAFEAVVRDVLDDLWGPATSAADGPLATVAAEARRLGWFDLGSGSGLAPVVRAVRATGRVGCPLPLMDAFVAHRLGCTDGSGLVAVVPATDPVDHVDAAAVLDGVVVLPAGGGPVARHPVAEVWPTPGMAVPAWSRVRLGPPEPGPILSPEAAAQASTLLRLGLAVRAIAAAERTHELATEHAKVRHQFGRPIGAFGAVQQRLAAREIDVRAAHELVDEVVDRYDRADPEWSLAAEVAVTWVETVATAVQLDAHHTLGAVGYFEEHEGPWLFRRVHADLARISSFRPPGSSLGDRLAEGGHLPAVPDTADCERLRSELRDLFAAARTGPDEYDAPGLVAAMAGRGLFGLGWPESVGGRDASLVEQVVLAEEVRYWRVPVLEQTAAVDMIGHAIVRHGTAEQKARLLPLIRQGRLRFCLGYSEPEAGSDLASLRTRAVRDGTEWVIDGQKTWTTRAHVADHIWLAVRTDPDARPRHAGITIFLVPMDSPGITVHEHRSLAGEISCSVFLDGVRVPDDARVGAVGEGWRVITSALTGERVHMAGVAGSVLRQLDDLLARVHRDPDDVLGPRGSAGRVALGALAAKLQAVRALVAAAARVPDRAGRAPLAPMAAVLAGELAEEFGSWVLRLLGPDALLAADDPRAPVGGHEAAYRLSLRSVIAGGTNDVQRGLIARGLGLPRGH